MNFEQIENEELRAELKAQFETALSEARDAAFNDADHVKKIKFNALKEAERKELQRLKKAFNLDTTEVEGLESADDYIKIGVEKAKKDQTQTGQEWQDKYLALREDFTKVQDELIPSLKAEGDNKIRSYQVEAALVAKLSSFENLIVPKEDLPLLVKAKLANIGIKLELSEDGKINALTNDNLKPVINEKTLDFDGVVNHFVSPYIKQNGSQDPPSSASSRVQVPVGMSDAKRAIIAKYEAQGVAIPEALLKA